MFNALNYAILKTQLQQIAAQGANRSMLWRKTASGNPVSAYPVPESPMYPKVSGTFSQSGTGDPSPSNIRPITPWLANGASVSVVQTDGDTIALIAPQEIPAGWMDNEGNGQVTWATKVFDGSETWYASTTSGAEKRNVLSVSGIANPDTVDTFAALFCSHHGTSTANLTFLKYVGVSVQATQIWFYDPNYNTSDISLWKAYLAAQYAAGTPVTIYYQLATPIDITPAAAPLTALAQVDRITPRQNVLTASTGQIELTYAKSPIRESDDIAAAIAAL